MATISKNNRKFTDLDLRFRKHPITADVTRLVDDEAIKRAVINLIMFRPYDIPFHPEISSQVNYLLFELASPIITELIRTTIIQVIDKFEPRVNIIEVTVNDNSDRNSYDVTVEYLIVGSERPYTINTILYRAR